MQMLHPHDGSIQQYMTQIEDSNCGRPSSCPQCRAKQPLTAHGFYGRTIVDQAFDSLDPNPAVSVRDVSADRVAVA
jgi:hypothetical protein